MHLKGKKILLGITGGIAAYKACELLRILQKRGAEVRVVMTDEATKFVGPTTFAALSQFPVYTSAESKPLQHIEYSRWADIYLIAPCSATTLSRLATGSGEEPVSLCFLANSGEKFIAPAMNSVMYGSPAVQRNLQTLENWKAKIIKPAMGYLACGEEGVGKFPEPEDIADELEFGTKKEKRMTITIGRTEEAIDPVRYISNRSSGKTGVAIVKEFLRNGWDVTAICGPMEEKLPNQCGKFYVKSSSEMNAKMMEAQKFTDVIIHCAAVADYRPKNIAKEKIKDSRAVQSLELEETENILRNTIKNRAAEQKIVSFALETENALENAKKKFNEGMDVLVVNKAGNFGNDSVEFGILSRESNDVNIRIGSKEELAAQLFRTVALKN